MYLLSIAIRSNEINVFRFIFLHIVESNFLPIEVKSS